jgi:NIPSNAP
MKAFLTSVFLLAACYNSFAQKADNRYYEMRIYYCLPGRLDALIDRFQSNTTRIFEKHGMENIGYWVPVTNDKNALYYILAYPSKEAREKSWAGFMADPEWKDVAAKSEVNGKILESITSVFMKGADLLPMINGANSSSQDRLFELRTYSCLPGRFPNIVTRFNDHTIKLFEQHQMENIAYFISEEKDGAQSKLVYIVAHQNQDAATKSWAEFRADPTWIAARDASEKDGKIVEKVESIFMKPLSFSKIK